MTDSEKLDKIISEVSEIKQHIAVYEVKSEMNHGRLKKVEDVVDKYKTDKAKVVGGSVVLSGIVAWLAKHL